MTTALLAQVSPIRALKQERLVRLARAATCALHDELILFPKPGLVSLQDNGSHRDMTASTFMRSLFALRHYFLDVTKAGARSCGFSTLVELGIEAERAMLRATCGINTHRGAIFTLGLLCASAGDLAQRSRPVAPQSIRSNLLELWGSALRERCTEGGESHGAKAARQYGLRGARWEGALGFPVLFEITIPALIDALDQGLTQQDAQLQALFHTMASLDDTNLVSRGGMEGLRWAQTQAKRFLASGGMAQATGRAQATAVHAAFVERRLSPGGSADLLAAACWVVRISAAP